MINEWFVIANPTAGRGEVKRRWPELEKAIMSALPIGEIAFSESRGHAIELAQQAIASGHHKILAIGGDGTNHEVANGILQQPHHPSERITYALIPIGTGNDWVKTHGISPQLSQVIEVVKREHTMLQDVGLIRYQKNGQQATRYFVNVAGMAYDAYICRAAEISPEAVRNQFYYLWLVFKCLFKYRLRKAHISIDGQQYSGKYYTINLGIGRYSGGGMQLVPHANPTGGQFAITLAGNISKLGVIINTYRFYNGSIGQHPKVQVLNGKKVRVAAGEEWPTLLEADGEFLGETPVEFELIPQALKIVVP